MEAPAELSVAPEAPWPPAPPALAGRRLLWGLGAAALLLAATCAACVARTWVVPPPGLSFSGEDALQANARAQALNRSRQEQGNYAKLQAQSVLLANETLSWFSEEGIESVRLSPDLSYHKDKRQLEVAANGTYYVFLQLKLIRRVKTTGQVSGRVSLKLQSQPPRAEAAGLALTVDLLSCLPQAWAEGFRGRLLHLQAGQRLSVRLSAHLQGEAHAHQHWELDPSSTVLGLFQVPTNLPTVLFE